MKSPPLDLHYWLKPWSILKTKFCIEWAPVAQWFKLRAFTVWLWHAITNVVIYCKGLRPERRAAGGQLEILKLFHKCIMVLPIYSHRRWENLPLYWAAVSTWQPLGGGVQQLPLPRWQGGLYKGKRLNYYQNGVLIKSSSCLSYSWTLKLNNCLWLEPSRYSSFAPLNRFQDLCYF